MNVQVRDLPASENDTLAQRLRRAREDKGLSRAALHEITGIPAKSIEKFEYGQQEPSVSRLRTLCDALDITEHWAMGLPGEAVEAEPGSEEQAPEPVADLPSRQAPARTVRPVDAARLALETIDDYRSENFEGSQRKALAAIEDVGALLRKLEPHELIRLAEERGLHKGECPSAANLFDLFSTNVDQAQSYCGDVEARIIDTAVLGVDLFRVEREPLTGIARSLSDEFDIDQPRFLSWGEHHELIPVIRYPMRTKAISGNGHNLDDIESFPRRV